MTYQIAHSRAELLTKINGYTDQVRRPVLLLPGLMREVSMDPPYRSAAAMPPGYRQRKIDAGRAAEGLTAFSVEAADAAILLGLAFGGLSETAADHVGAYSEIFRFNDGGIYVEMHCSDNSALREATGAVHVVDSVGWRRDDPSYTSDIHPDWSPARYHHALGGAPLLGSAILHFNDLEGQVLPYPEQVPVLTEQAA